MQESEPQYLEFYFLKDRETLTSYTGFPANGYTNTEKGIIYFVDNEPFNLAFRHELSASFVQYIYDNYGTASLKKFWQSGLKSANEIIGVSPLELERKWKEYIDHKKFETDINWSKIKKSDCE